jgi:hypothetical protein
VCIASAIAPASATVPATVPATVSTTALARALASAQTASAQTASAQTASAQPAAQSAISIGQSAQAVRRVTRRSARLSATATIAATFSSGPLTARVTKKTRRKVVSTMASNTVTAFVATTQTPAPTSTAAATTRRDASTTDTAGRPLTIEEWDDLFARGEFELEESSIENDHGFSPPTKQELRDARQAPNEQPIRTHRRNPDLPRDERLFWTELGRAIPGTEIAAPATHTGRGTATRRSTRRRG